MLQLDRFLAATRRTKLDVALSIMRREIRAVCYGDYRSQRDTQYNAINILIPCARAAACFLGSTLNSPRNCPLYIRCSCTKGICWCKQSQKEFMMDTVDTVKGNDPFGLATHAQMMWHEETVQQRQCITIGLTYNTCTQPQVKNVACPIICMHQPKIIKFRYNS